MFELLHQLVIFLLFNDKNVISLSSRLRSLIQHVSFSQIFKPILHLFSYITNSPIPICIKLSVSIFCLRKSIDWPFNDCISTIHHQVCRIYVPKNMQAAIYTAHYIHTSYKINYRNCLTWMFTQCQWPSFTLEVLHNKKTSPLPFVICLM